MQQSTPFPTKTELSWREDSLQRRCVILHSYEPGVANKLAAESIFLRTLCNDLLCAATLQQLPYMLWSPASSEAPTGKSPSSGLIWKRWKPFQLMALSRLRRRATTPWLRNHIAPRIIRSVCSPSHQDDTNWTLSLQVWHLAVQGFEQANVGQSLIKTQQPSNYTLLL